MESRQVQLTVELIVFNIAYDLLQKSFCVFQPIDGVERGPLALRDAGLVERIQALGIYRLQSFFACGTVLHSLLLTFYLCIFFARTTTKNSIYSYAYDFFI